MPAGLLAGEVGGFGAPRRLATTEPFDGATLFAFLRRFAVPGVEAHTGVGPTSALTRTLRLAHGPAAVRLAWDGRSLDLAYAGDPTDEDDAIARVRTLVDADAAVDPVAATLGSDPHLADDVASSPGLRLPGSTDTAEAAVQALVSQQISMAAAARCSAKLTETYGDEVVVPGGAVERLFPQMEALAEADPTALPMPRAGAGRWSVSRRRSPPARWRWTGNVPGPSSVASCWRCRGSVRGRRTSSGCVRWVSATSC